MLWEAHNGTINGYVLTCCIEQRKSILRSQHARDRTLQKQLLSEPANAPPRDEICIDAGLSLPLNSTIGNDIESYRDSKKIYMLKTWLNNSVVSDAGNSGIDDERFIIAKRCSGGPSFDGSDGTMHVCYGCGKSVHWVKPFQRKMCGINQQVNGHFRHNKRTDGCSGGESMYHKAAKDAILTGEGWSFYATCKGVSGRGCDQAIEVEVPQYGKNDEVSFQRFFLDVGVCDASNRVIGAIEILHTSAIKADKRAALVAAGVAWVEVRSKDVLDIYRVSSRGGRVKVVDCAAMQCDACVTHQSELDSLECERRALEEAKSARKARFEQERIQILAGIEDAVKAKHVIGDHGSASVAKMLTEESDVSCTDGSGPPPLFWSEVVITAAGVLGIDLQSIDVQREAETAKNMVSRQAAIEASKSRGSHVLQFGKHNGNTVELLFDDCDTRTYVRWLAGYTGYKEEDSNRPATVCTNEAYAYVPKEVADEARRLLKGTCLLCFEQTDPEWKSWCSLCFRRVCKEC